MQAADLPFPFSPHFPFARVGRVRPLLPHSPIPSPILTRNSFGACLLPTPRPPPVCVSLSRSASDGVLLGLLFTPCQQLHIMHKWNGYSCIRYSPLFSLMPVLPHFSTSSICHASISSFHPTPRRTVSVPAGRRNFPLHSNIESWRNSQTIIQWISCLPRAQRARSTVGCTGEAADWVLALLPQSTSVIRSPARSGLRGRSTIVPCRSKTHSAVLSNFLSVSSRFIWPRSSAASFRAPLLSSSSAAADVCPSTVLHSSSRHASSAWPFLAFPGFAGAIALTSLLPSSSSSLQISRNVLLNERPRRLMPTTHPPKVPVLWREYLLWLLDVSHILAALSHSQSGKLK